MLPGPQKASWLRPGDQNVPRRRAWSFEGRRRVSAERHPWTHRRDAGPLLEGCCDALHHAASMTAGLPTWERLTSAHQDQKDVPTRVSGVDDRQMLVVYRSQS